MKSGAPRLSKFGTSTKCPGSQRSTDLESPGDFVGGRPSPNFDAAIVRRDAGIGSWRVRQFGENQVVIARGLIGIQVH